MSFSKSFLFVLHKNFGANIYYVTVLGIIYNGRNMGVH